MIADTKDTIIVLSTPLPCGHLIEDRHCGRKATFAYAVTLRDHEVPLHLGTGQYWAILPICPRCRHRILQENLGDK